MTVSPKKQPVPFGKYLLLDRVNIGGMAEVWRGKAFGPNGFERLVAIKRILPNIGEDEEFVSMFIDEAKICVQLTHTNIAQIFDLGQIASSYFIAMEYISGKDCRAIFDKCRKKGAPAPIPLACYLTAKMSDGLDYAHKKRDGRGDEMHIVHRDVSPQNVLVSYDGEVKVIDFGIAKAAGKANRTQAGILKGKFGYMSPEQVRGQDIDHRVDVFAIGICLFELLTGERLFIGETDFQVLEKVRNGQVPRPSSINPNIPSALDRIVLKALAPDREQRYQWASELSEDLQRFLIAGDHDFSRKDLAQFMHEAFAEEMVKEDEKLREYGEARPPEGFLEALGVLPPGRRPTGSQRQVAAPPPPPPEAAEEEEGGATLLINEDMVKVALAEQPSPPDETTAPNASAKKLSASIPVLTPIPPGATAMHLSPLGLLRAAEAEATNAGGMPRKEESNENSTDTDLRVKANQPVSLLDAPPIDPSQATQQKPLPAPPMLDEVTNPAGRAPQAPMLESAPEPEPEPEEAPAAEPDPDDDEPTPPPRARPRRKGPLFAIFALLLIVSALGIVYISRGMPQGYVLIDVPAAARATARVNLAGKDFGVPAQWPVLMRASVGKSMLMVKADGFAPFAQAVQVNSGEVPIAVQANLQPLHALAKLMVTPEPELAEVRLDGKVLKKEGQSGFGVADLAVNQISRLEVRRHGYAPYAQTVVARQPGETVTLKPKLEAIERTVDVSSMPAGASVVVGNETVGTTPATIKVPGTLSKIILHKRCYHPTSLTLSPAASNQGPVSLHATLVKQPNCR